MPEPLDEIVRRVVAIASPDRIILFGSRARGEMSASSERRGPLHPAPAPHRFESCSPFQLPRPRPFRGR